MTFHNLFQQIFTSLRGRESPISYLQKVIETAPQNRKDLNLQMQLEDYKQIRHLLVLKNEERIALHMLLQGESYEKMVNELPHLFLIAKLERSRSYLLKDFKEVNPSYHKMGDIYVPSKGRKYEVKSYDKLVKFKIRGIIKQYEKNDFLTNDVQFSIIFQDIVSGSSVELFREQLSDGLKLPLTNIHFCSMKEMREEVGDVRTIFSQYYSMEYKEYLMEQQMVFSKTIKNLSKYLVNKREREKMEKLVKGLENPLYIKDKEVKRLLRRLVSMDRKVENLDSGLGEEDDLPPSGDLMDVD